MDKTANSVVSANAQSRVSWGKFVRAQQLASERSHEYVINHQAPLPPPAVLQDYDLAFPGTADRILNLLEQGVLHQRVIETKQVDAAVSLARTREVCTFIMRFAAVIGVFTLIWYGKSLAGTMAFIVTLVAGQIRPVKTNKQKLEQREEVNGPEHASPAR